MEKTRRAAQRDTGSMKREAIDELSHRAERAAGAQALRLQMAPQAPWMPVFWPAIEMKEEEEKERVRLKVAWCFAHATPVRLQLFCRSVSFHFVVLLGIALLARARVARGRRAQGPSGPFWARGPKGPPWETKRPLGPFGCWGGSS